MSIDPEIVAGLEGQIALSLARSVSENDLAGMRESARAQVAAVALTASNSDDVSSTDGQLEAGDGSEVNFRLYGPNGHPDPLPAVLFFHGGGFVLGDLDSEDARCRQLVRQAQCKVVSVDYRLAPEFPFPVGLEDCYSALQWVDGHADELGIDRDRIAVAGPSAGGGLAAALCLLARDRKGPEILAQVLMYPVIDDRMATASMAQFSDTPIWDGRSNRVMWELYLGDRADEPTSRYAAPGRAEDLSGLPPAYIGTAEFDPLRDEGLQYAMDLLVAGVSVELHQFPGTIHGFDAHVPFAQVSQRAAQEQASYLSRIFAAAREQTMVATAEALDVS